MAAQQYNVNLSFTADTSQAKQQIAKLHQSLSNLASGTGLKNSGISSLTPELKSAMQAAQQLKAAVEGATNVDTGKLNLNKFNASLKASGQTLSDYAVSLTAIGPQGTAAFQQLVRSISSAESPLINLNKKMAAFGTTIKNAAKWQISSTILHGLQGAVQQAFGYAKDLNASLNDIRIVTGQSTDQMARFADQANRAAKALGTTTTNYTKAALIYYQQGLDDDQVKARTDVTTKMANVSGQSAEAVSDQMTAIWNNFAKGSENIEHFADVLTKLGAETASSSDEIAQGMEKFAAIADTIGLSYNNAAAALTTITATTRQSADTVGTSLKTIFARIQGLNLGDTLDDGTTLNKYSVALNKIGVSIKDESGNLKNMDAILADMGEKWKGLSKDQQVATAQTVAGVRQYAQLVALMDNYDFYKENVNRAENADGSLQEQQDIYAQSWEAASKKVKASMEDIYDSLINDEFFIKLTNGFAGFLDLIGNAVDALGGLKGILFIIGGIVNKMFGQQIIADVKSIGLMARDLISKDGGAARRNAAKNEAIGLAKVSAGINYGNSQEGQIMTTIMGQEAELQEVLLSYSGKITAEQQKQLEIKTKTLDAQQKMILASAKEVDKENQKIKALKEQDLQRTRQAAKEKLKEQTDDEKQETRNKILDERNENKEKWVNNQVNQRMQKPEKGTPQKINKNVKKDKRDAYRKEAEDAYDKETQRQLELAFSPTEAARKSADIRAKEQSRVEKQAKIVGTGKAIGAYAESSTQHYKNQLNIANAITSQGGNADQAKATVTQQYVGETKAMAKALADSVGGVEQLAEKFADLGAKSPEEVKEIINSIEKLTSTEEGAGEKAQELQEKISSMGEKIASSTDAKVREEGLDDDLEEIYNASVGEAKQVAEEITMPLETVKEGMREVGQTADKMSQDTANSWETRLQSTTSAVMSFGMALSSVQGLVDVFNNPNTSGWEKLQAVITSVPMIIMGITQAAKGLQAAGILTQISWGWVSAILLGVIALGAVAVAVFKDIQANSPEGQLKKAKEEADNAKKAFEDLSNEIENTNSKLEELKSAQEILSSLTAGTDEWYQSLTQISTAVNDILSTYPELISMGMIEYVNGIATLKNEAFEYIKQQQKEATIAAQTEILYTNAKTANKTNDKVSSSKADWYNKRFATNFTSSTTKEAFRNSGINNSELLLQILSNTYLKNGNLLFQKLNTDNLVDTNATYKLFQGLLDENVLNLDLLDDYNTVLLDFANAVEKCSEDIISYANNIKIQSDYIENVQKQGLSAMGSNFTIDQYKDYAAKYNVDLDNGANEKGSNYKGLLYSAGFNAETIKSGLKYFLGFGNGSEKLTFDYDSTRSAYEKITGKRSIGMDLFPGAILSGQAETVLKNSEELQNAIKTTYGNYEYKRVANDKVILSGKSGEEDISVDIEEFSNKIQSYLDSADIREKIIEVSKAFIQEGFEDGFNEATDEQIISMSNFKQDLLSSFGDEEGKELFSSFLELSKGDVNDLVSKFEYINLTSSTALDGLKEKISAISANTKGATNEIELMDNALHQLNEEAKLDSMNDYFSEQAEASDLKGEADNLKAYAQHLMSLAEEQDGLNDNIEISAQKYADLAISITKMNTGIQDLCDNFEDLESILRDGSKRGTKEYSDSLLTVAKDLSKILDVSEEVFTEDFIQNNWNDIAGAAEGSEESINNLLETIENKEIENIKLEIDVDNTEALAALDEISQYLDNGFDDLEVGASINDENFIAGLKSMYEATNMTTEDILKSLGKMNIGAEVETKTLETPKEDVYNDAIPVIDYDTQATTNLPLGDGTTTETNYSIPTIRYKSEPNSIKGVAQSVATSITPTVGEGAKGINWNSLYKKNNGHSATKPSKKTSSGGGGSGGGSSKPAKKQKTTKKSAIVERYKEINDQLKDIQHEVDKTNKIEEGLYGADKLKSMQKRIDLLKQESKLNEEKLKWAKQYEAEDKAGLEQAAKELGANIVYAEDGHIINYTEIAEAAWKEYNAMQQKWANPDNWGSSDAQSEYKEAYLDPLKERIDGFEEYRKAYEEDLDERRELELKNIDLINEERALKLEQLTYKVDLQIKVNDRELKMLDYYLNKIEDDFYQSVETFNLLNNKQNNAQDNLETLAEAYKDLEEAYKNNEISAEQYIQRSEELSDNMREQLGNIVDLDKEMKEFFNNTVDKGIEKITELSSRFEHFNSILDYYKQLVTMTKGQYAFEDIEEILKGQKENAINEFQTAKALYERLDQDRKVIKERLGNITDPEEYKKEKDKLDKITKEADKVQEDMLSKATTVAELMQNLYENAINAAKDKLEKALTNGKGFSQLGKEMNLDEQEAELYLTSFNKVYETDKLIRDIQKDINKTTSKAASARLTALQNETKELQKQDKLTKTAMEIQRAKFALLQAELDLENARNSKTTVRLKRDIEGNFGYVYTADTDAIADAEQKVQDSQNNIYQIAYDALSNYTKSSNSLMEQFFNDLAELEEKKHNKIFKSEEEYLAARQALENKYQNVLLGITANLNVAQDASAEAVRDSWTTAYNNSALSIKDWRDSAVTFTREAQKAFDDFDPSTLADDPTFGDIMITVLGNIKTGIKDVITESNNLKTTLIGKDGKSGVVKAVNDEITAVDNETSKYSKLSTQLKEVIEKYETMIKKIDAVIAEQSKLKGVNITNTVTTEYIPKGSAPQEVNTTPENTNDRGSSKDGSGDGGYTGGRKDGVSKTPTRQKSYHADAIGGYQKGAMIASIAGTSVTADGKNYILIESKKYVAAGDKQYFQPIEEVVRGPGGKWVRQVTGYKTTRKISTYKISYYDTGGYTGAWGPEGKLAMLHEKEIVLNKHDTANLLASVNVMRDIAKSIDLNKTSTVTSLGALPTMSTVANKSENLQQQIYIDATFPDVVDRYEIEEAFKELANVAVQYANRK